MIMDEALCRIFIETQAPRPNDEDQDHHWIKVRGVNPEDFPPEPSDPEIARAQWRVTNVIGRLAGLLRDAAKAQRRAHGCNADLDGCGVNVWVANIGDAAVEVTHPASEKRAWLERITAALRGIDALDREVGGWR